VTLKKERREYYLVLKYEKSNLIHIQTMTIL